MLYVFVGSLIFQSTLPMRGATIHVSFSSQICAYFNPHSPCGERLAPTLAIFMFLRFQSTLPMRGATGPSVAACVPQSFQSTLPMRGATLSVGRTLSLFEFQSTLPMRGATPYSISPFKFLVISIHTPHAGSDQNWCIRIHCRHISIHTPHAGSDNSYLSLFLSSAYFNPHSPCGERPQHTFPCRRSQLFQSTLPMRGATAKVTEFTLNLKTKFMTFGTKTNCETLQSSVSRICSNEKNYISQVRISKQFMIASHSHIYKISGSSGIYDALFPKCSTFF